MDFQKIQTLHPKIPHNLSISNVTDVEATLEWEGESGEIYINGELLIQEASSPFVLDNLTEATEYRVQVVNSGGKSETITFKTQHLVVETIVLDFNNKVAGSEVENANIAKYAVNTELSKPDSNAFVEISQGRYTSLSSLDSSVATVQTSVKDSAAKVLSIFNVVEELSRQRPILFNDAATLSEKVNILKQKVDKMSYNIHGYGAGATGNLLTTKVFAFGGANTWEAESETNATNTIQKLTRDYPNNYFKNRIGQDGCVYVIAYAPSSDGTTVSAVNIDYTSLELTIQYLAD